MTHVRGGAGRIYLFVPFEEREVVLQLGASWDADAKCCYIESQRAAGPFRRWLRAAPIRHGIAPGEGSAPAADDGAQSLDGTTYAIVSDEAFVLSARTRCWKCRASLRVTCIYCESGSIHGERYEQFMVSNITAIDAPLRRQLEGLRNFHFAYDRLAGGRYLVNHCPRCQAQQADYYLHCEPGGAFFTLRDAPAGALEAAPLSGRVRLTGDEGFEP